MSTSNTPVIYALDGQVATLTINRPERMNSLDFSTVEALLAGIDSALADQARVLVLTGSGRAFCAGADLTSVLEQRGADGVIDIGTPLERYYNRLVKTLADLPIPVLIAVNGMAVGGGASLAICGDVVIAARSASFRQNFADIGLMPDMGASWLMPRLAGRARSRGFALLAENISAEKALDWGLIWEVVDDADLAGRVRMLARRLASLPPSALRAARLALDIGAGNDLASQLDLEARMQGELGRQAEFSDAVAAFFSRRANNK